MSTPESFFFKPLAAAVAMALLGIGVWSGSCIYLEFWWRENNWAWLGLSIESYKSWGVSFGLNGRISRLRPVFDVLTFYRCNPDLIWPFSLILALLGPTPISSPYCRFSSSILFCIYIDGVFWFHTFSCSLNQVSITLCIPYRALKFFKSSSYVESLMS